MVAIYPCYRSRPIRVCIVYSQERIETYTEDVKCKIICYILCKYRGNNILQSKKNIIYVYIIRILRWCVFFGYLSSLYPLLSLRQLYSKFFYSTLPRKRYDIKKVIIPNNIIILHQYILLNKKRKNKLSIINAY